MEVQENGRTSLRTIPCDELAERYLIGAVIISRPALVSVVDKLVPENFFNETHRVTFRAIQKLHRANSGVDWITLKDELRRMGKLDYVGGMRFIRQAMENVPSVANAEGYMLIILKHSASRNLQDIADHLHADASNDTLDVEDVLAHAMESIAKVRPPADNGEVEAGRVLLGRGIEEGIEPPAELEPDVLLRGKVHSIYAAPGTGKTFLALWLTAQAVEREETVLVLDSENGPRIISERLADLGTVAAKVDEYLHYHPYPSLTLAVEDRKRYEALLATVKPELVIFDSWLNSLAASGLDENSSNDVAQWSTAYARPARERGITVVILDHVPHEGEHSRGSTRKKDEVDVMWRLRRRQTFDRDTVGEVALHREKDREGWLPPSVTFSVGGTLDGGFVFARSEGTLEERQEPLQLLRTERSAMDALRECGAHGVSDALWRKAAAREPYGVSRATYYRAKRELLDRGYVCGESGVFRVAKGASRECVVSNARETSTTTSGLTRSHESQSTENGVPMGENDTGLKRSRDGLTAEMRPGDPEVSLVSPPLKGETSETVAETDGSASDQGEKGNDLQARLRARSDKLHCERDGGGE